MKVFYANKFYQAELIRVDGFYRLYLPEKNVTIPLRAEPLKLAA